MWWCVLSVTQKEDSHGLIMEVCRRTDLTKQWPLFPVGVETDEGNVFADQGTHQFILLMAAAPEQLVARHDW